MGKRPTRKTAKSVGSRRPKLVRRRATRAGHAEGLETQYRLVFEHDLIGMYQTRLDGRILDCNESAARMLGYASRADLMRHSAQELYHSPANRRDFVRRLRRAGTLTSFELRMRRKDGSDIYVLENVTFLARAGKSPATIQGTMVDITERRRAETVLRESERRYRALVAELRHLARHVQRVREMERTRIAREMHDELGQALTVLNMDLHGLRDAVADASESRGRIDAMNALVDGAIRTLRRICTDLRPTVLDDLGLVAAIEWQAREFAARTGIRCRSKLPNRSPELPKDQATAVFRILQESLTNVARHSRATELTLRLGSRSGTLILDVEDNGVGIRRDQSSDARSLGILGMRERALEWGGQVEIDGSRAQGTRVTLRMPLGPTTRGAMP